MTILLETLETKITSFNILSPEGGVIASGRENEGSDEYFIYNKDVRGSTTNILSDSGACVANYTYTDFGETSAGEDTDFDNEICYTGGMYDEETGEYYLNARYYDPAEGRFTTQDSYRGENTDKVTWHLYSYCDNDPIVHTDVSGHKAFVLLAPRAINKWAKYFGHLAVLVKDEDNKKWYFYEWAQYGADFKKIPLKKGIVKKGGRVDKEKLNKAVQRKKRKFSKSLYLKAVGTGSFDYVVGLENREYYTEYSATGRNCAWVAVDIMMHGTNNKTKHQKLWDMLYRYNNRGDVVMRLVLPKPGIKKVAKIFGKKIKKMK